MGKDRRKKDVNRKQVVSSTSDAIGSEPKGQREPRSRASQDRTKNVESSVKDKIVENVPPPQPLPKEELPDPKEMFANLKRETDDIKALSTKKTPSRQILSSWTSYNKQLPDPNQEVEMQGADFIDLVQAPISAGGHFQFKSEKSWDASVSALSGELFSLNIDLLSAGLATIPLYDKLDLPLSLFSPFEIEDMDYSAKQSQTRYESTKKNMAEQFNKKQSIMHMQEILTMKESSPEASEQVSADKNSDALSFDIEGPQIQDEVLEVDVPKKNSTVSPAKEAPVIGSHDLLKPNAIETKVSVDLPKKEVTPVREVAAVVGKSDYYKPNSVGTKYSTDLPKEDSATVAPVKEVPGTKRPNHHKGATSKKPEVNKITPKPTQEVDSNLNPTAHQFTGDKVTSSIKSEADHMNIPAENNKTESKIAPVTVITSKTEAISISEEVKKAPEVEGSESQKLEEESAAPRGQRSGKRKPKDRAAGVQKEKVGEKKSQNVDDDLDFLLGLKKPVRSAHTPISQSVQVTKPTIEDDDASSSQITLVGAQKQTEDLEDWLDLMLDD